MRKVIIKKNRYVDSVSLMGVSDRVMDINGVENVEAQMATQANLQLLRMLGYVLDEAATANDLVIAVTADCEKTCADAVTMVENIIDRKDTGDCTRYSDLNDIDMCQTPYDLCQISLPGEYAAAEAKKALYKGMDLFIFSDNVPLEEELELKRLGQSLGRLVMGPDAGVALIGGVALAAGSIIRPGPIGIVAASGSGAQEVGCIIERLGMGVSGIIGTGGRDLYPQIGGITMMEGIRRMEADPETKVIALVSKLADLDVMDKVLTVADTCTKPMAAVFLGSGKALFEGHKAHGTFSLEGCALEAVRLAGGETGAFGYSDEQIQAIVRERTAALRPEQKFFRGLYCGGTFTEEALQYFSGHNAGIKLYSNLSNGYSVRLTDPEQSVGHAILDLGSEEFTAKAPHPVFDPGLRLKRLRQELADPAVAVVLLDFITGPGVAQDPITPFAEECAKHPDVVFISNICGSAQDPQDVSAKEKLLRAAGVLVTPSSYQSARLASAMMNAL